MVVQLVQPVWVWGLLALAIPVAVHLLHKRSRKVVRVGSLQTFRGGTPVQAKSIQLNEVGLLLLRCLLLAVLVLLLAEPVWFPAEERAKTLFVAEGILGETGVSKKLDSLGEIGYELRLLTPGLPMLSEAKRKAESSVLAVNYWDVFKEIEGQNQYGDTALVLFRPYLKNFAGKRPQLHTTFIALDFPSKEEREAPVLLSKQKEGTTVFAYKEAKEGQWQLQQQLTDQPDTLSKHLTSLPQLPDTVKVLLQYSRAEHGEVAWWHRALHLLDEAIPAYVITVEQHEIGQEEAFTSRPDLWVWLSETPPPQAFQTASASIKAYLQLSTEREGWFQKSIASDSLYLINKRFAAVQNQGETLAAFMPVLQELLPMPAESRPPMELAAQQWLPEKRSEPLYSQAKEGKPLEHYLWIILLFLFLLERWASLRK